MAILGNPPLNVPISSPGGSTTAPWQGWFTTLWQRVGGAVGGLFPSASISYIVQQADASAPNAQSLGLLKSGFLKSTAVSGKLVSTGNTTIQTSDLGSRVVTANNLSNGGVFTGDVTSTYPAITVTSIRGNAISSTNAAAVANLSGTNTGDQTNITGNAATVTTNANLTGPVTSVGNTTAIANGTITNAMLANGAVANLSGTNTGDQTISDATITTTNITTNNVSTSKHGFAPKGNGTATTYLDGTGAYSTPSGTNTAGRLLNIQIFTASGTYTPTSGTNGIKATGVGAGGGGSGTGVGAGAGGNGGTTVLGTLLIANGGTGGPNNAGGAGGVAGTGTIHLPGASGNNGEGLNANVIDGGDGGAGIYGSGAGIGGASTGSGTAGATNTGAGGGGGGGSATTNSGGGGGGGATEIYYTSTGITGTYTVTLNSGGSAGAGAVTGGAGAKGILIIEEYS